MGEHLRQRRASCRLWAFNGILTLSSRAYIEKKKNWMCFQEVLNYCWKLNVTNGLFTACAPTFIYNPVKKVLLGAENGRAVIECKPRAAPKPKFIWKRGSELLTNSSRLVSRSYMLAFPYRWIIMLWQRQELSYSYLHPLLSSSLSFRMLIWDDGSLEILNASKSDEGSYTCYAENDRGKSNSTGTLTITGQTKF